MDVFHVILGLALTVCLLLRWSALAELLKEHWSWLLGLAVLLGLTVIGLYINNNVPKSPTSALTDWTGWFASIVALVVAVFGIVKEVPKIAKSFVTRADARLSEAEASRTEAEASRTEAEASRTEAEASRTEAEARESEAEARKTEAEASKSQRQAEALLAANAAIQAGVPEDVIDKILAGGG